jgi:transposase-like protein
MRTSKEEEGKVCPKCGSGKGQAKAGHNRSGTRRCRCFNCGYKYTLNPKSVAITEEIKDLAIKEHYAGASGRSIGRIHGMSKANVYNWIKKTERGVDKSGHETIGV